MIKLLTALTLIALSADINAAPQAAPQSQQADSAYLIRAIHIAMDFDGGHSYYVRLEDPERGLSTWELRNHSDFYKVVAENWETGDEVHIDNGMLTNLTRGSQYPFDSVGDWWPKKK